MKAFSSIWLMMENGFYNNTLKTRSCSMKVSCLELKKNGLPRRMNIFFTRKLFLSHYEIWNRENILMEERSTCISILFMTMFFSVLKMLF